MSKLDKNRQRLLVISRAGTTRNDLVTLLTGYGYYVDYADNRLDGLRKFRQHKQPVVICDMLSLPRFPGRLFKVFRSYRRNPMILVAATSDQERLVYPYLSQGVFDIVQLPLRVDYLHFVLRRMVRYDQLTGRLFFLQTILLIVLLVAPIWLLLVYLVSRYWW
jgi:DNA-binding NtrC family response regulator